MSTGLGFSKIRSIVVLCAVAVVVIAAVTTVAVRSTAVASAAPSEDDGAGCQVALPGSWPSSAGLPDPFTKLDGARISTKSEWRCRRAEIREMAEAYLYGDKPGKPATVTGAVSASSISVNVADSGRSSSFSASVELPSGSGPFPAVVVLGGFGADTTTIKAAGAAVITYDPLAVGKEGTSRNNKQGVFYDLYGSSSGTGLLAAWAWGVSRIIDVVEQSGGSILKADALGVTGCSRYGKGAFVTGAFDQRIALTMPIESGSAGVPALRAVAGESGAQPLSSAYSEQPWLGDGFGSFTGDPGKLPLDTHEVIGMVAPRGLFIMENPHVDWLSTRSGSVAALGGAEIYQALGARDNIAYWSDVQDGNHCATRSEWRAPLRQYIQRFLLGTGSVDGTFRISSSKAGDLSRWRNWQTPVLTDGPTTPPSTTNPPTTTTPPTSGDRCSASVSVNQWTGGFVATVRVTAGSAPINSWTVSTTLPPDARITAAWNADRSGDTGTVRFTNVGFNGTVQPGQSVEFGYQATGSGGGMTPTCTSG